MLQKTGSQVQIPYESPDQGGLDLQHYISILKRRKFLLVIPFIVVLLVGSAVVMLLPATYRSEAKILVESQQIPTDLVRPTVTATAKERMEVIQQRVTTRDNLLAIVDKFKLYPSERQRLSGSELLDLMRNHISMEPLELNRLNRSNASLTIALTVSFEHEVPQIARDVANELVTLILNEDARNRTNRAAETTKFLAREVKKLETDLATIDAQIAELQRKVVEAVPAKFTAQLITLRAELREKSEIYSEKHPDLVRIKRQIAALEEAMAKATGTTGSGALEALINKRASIQKNLESAHAKNETARLGESLERDQFSERLEVLEQAVLPQKPIKPNRPKLLALVFALSVMAGAGTVVAAETLNNSVRTGRDLFSIVDPHLVVSIPYIVTKAELARKKARIRWMAGGMVVASLLAIGAVHLFVRPLDELWDKVLVRFLG